MSSVTHKIRDAVELLVKMGCSIKHEDLGYCVYKGQKGYNVIRFDARADIIEDDCTDNVSQADAISKFVQLVSATPKETK